MGLCELYGGYETRKSPTPTNLIVYEVEDFYNRTSVSPELLELRNLISIAYLIIQAAMKRKESCGLHYNVLRDLW